MKIAFISLYLPSHLRGGVPVQAHLLANALVSRGHAIDVHTLYDPPEDAQYHVVKTVLPRPLERLNGRFEQVVSRYESIYRELADAKARPRACAESPADEAAR